jgi:hypothetical protein
VRAKSIAAVLAWVEIVLALGLLAGLALPGGALATPGHYSTQALTTEQFQLRGSNGYSLRVAVVNRSAQLIFDKRVGHSFLTVAYSVRGKLSPGPDLHFPIGKEGEVNLRFVHAAGPKKPRSPAAREARRSSKKALWWGLSASAARASSPRSTPTAPTWSSAGFHG